LSLRPSALFAAMVMALLAVAPAAAQIRLWKKVGEWNVHPHATLGCIAVRDTADGLFLSFSLDPRDDRTIVTIGNRKWQSIKDGQAYEVVLHLPPAPPWATTARGIRGKDSSLPILGAVGASREYLDRFARASSFELEYRNEIIGRVDLTGSSAAIAALLECRRSGGEQPPSVAPVAPAPPSAAPPSRPVPSLLPPTSGPAREAPPPSETSPQR